MNKIEKFVLLGFVCIQFGVVMIHVTNQYAGYAAKLEFILPPLPNQCFSKIKLYFFIMLFTEKHKFNEIKWNQHRNKYGLFRLYEKLK